MPTVLRTVVVAAVALGASLAAAPASGLAPAPTDPGPTPDTLMAGALQARAGAAVSGGRFSGQVVDAGSGEVVWGLNPGWQLRPASTTKLVTATSALAVFGARHRFTTSVVRGTSWRQVVLVGGGDPSLGSPDLTLLARTTAAALRRHGVAAAKVWFDDSLFAGPTPATGWKADYVPGDVRAVRSLVVDGHHVADTSADAAAVFAARLRAAGVRVLGVGRGRAPAGSPVTATVRGDRLDVIVAQMLLDSDNDHAEALHRLVALSQGQAATWAGAAAAQRSVLGGLGVALGPTQLYDGSGLSRRDRLSAAQLVQLVSRTLGTVLDPAARVGPPDPVSLVGTSLPVAGISGTLRASLGRYSAPPSSCAAGLVHAKTGTLDDAVALAGWTTGADGRVKVFAFVVNGAGDSLTLKRRVDNLAATVTGCY